jgi:hypothetical protein
VANSRTGKGEFPGRDANLTMPPFSLLAACSGAHAGTYLVGFGNSKRQVWTSASDCNHFVARNFVTQSLLCDRETPG